MGGDALLFYVVTTVSDTTSMLTVAKACGENSVNNEMALCTVCVLERARVCAVCVFLSLLLIFVFPLFPKR